MSNIHVGLKKWSFLIYLLSPNKHISLFSKYGEDLMISFTLQRCGVIELIKSEEATPPPPQLLIFLPSTILAEREIMIDITHTSGTIRLTLTFYYPPTRASL